MAHSTFSVNSIDRKPEGVVVLHAVTLAAGVGSEPPLEAVYVLAAKTHHTGSVASAESKRELWTCCLSLVGRESSLEWVSPLDDTYVLAARTHRVCG